MNRPNDDQPAASNKVTTIVIPVASIGIGIALSWLASRRDGSDWAYLIPIGLLLILLMFVAAPYVRSTWEARRARRSARVAARMYRPQLANVVCQFLSRSSASQTNTAQHVLHVLNNMRVDFDGIDYSPECDHSRTLFVWGQSVLRRLRSDTTAFDVVAIDAMEFIRSFLSFIDCAGRRIDNATIIGQPVSEELGRILSEWNAAVDHIIATTSHLYVIVGGVGEFTGIDYSDSYFQIPERLIFSCKSSKLSAPKKD